MLLINISKAFSIGGPVGMAIGAVIAVMAETTIIYAVMDYITNRELMIEYMEGNEAAGDELKQNANVNVGITLGVGIFSASAKGVVKAAAKSKVVKELGEEIAERIVKNTDDATNITKYLKNIKKAGVSQDAIKRVADTSGEAGLKWLEKQTKEGISKEVVEKIAKNANDCTKYTDELMEIIGLYEGRTDDIIEYVNKNGDDGVEEIFKLYETRVVQRQNYSYQMSIIKK